MLELVGPPVVVPQRLSGSPPSATVKLRYEGELHGHDKIARELIQGAAVEAFLSLIHI